MDSFKNARPRVLEFMKDAVAAADTAAAGIGAGEDDIEQPVTKRRRIAPSRSRGSHMTPREGVRKTRSQSRMAEETYNETFVVEDSQDEDYEDHESELEPEPEPSMPLHFKHFLILSLTLLLDDGLVACPMCSRRMKNEAVFSHLDACTGPAEQPKPQR